MQESLTIEGQMATETPEIIRAKKGRKGHRALVTRQIKQLEELLLLEQPNTSDITVLNNSLLELKTKLEGFDEVIQYALDEDAYLKDLEECADRKRTIDKAVLEAQNFLNVKSESNRSHSPTHSCCSNQLNSGYKLPQLKLPNFEGNILEFRSFWEQFTAAVDGRDLSDIIKLQLLLGCLRGSIRKSVSGYKIEGRSYQLVVNYLKDLFDNPPKIVESLILRLLKLQSPSYTYSSLHSFKSELQFLTQSLKSEGIVNDCNSCSIILGTILTQKLPSNLKDRLNWHHPRESWTLELLDSSLGQALAVLEAEGHHLTSEGDRAPKQTASSHKTNHTGGSNSKRTTTILTTTQSLPQDNKRRYPCRFCEGPHYPSDCLQYPTVDSRIHILQSKQWCEQCLSHRHTSSNCSTRRKVCFKCRIPGHHVALCPNSENHSESPSKGWTSSVSFYPSPRERPNSFESGTTSSSNFFSQSSQASHETSSRPPHNSKPSVGFSQSPPIQNHEVQSKGGNVSVNLSHANEGIALPLANLEIISNGRLHDIVALFDQGSQVTLISEEKCKQLKLIPHRQVRTSINGINQKGGTCLYHVVHLFVRTEDGLTELEVIVTPTFPTSVHISGLKKATSILKDFRLKLAYPHPPADTVDDISILVGCDNLHKFLRGSRTLNGVNLMDSTLGYLLWGPLPAGVTDQVPHAGTLSVLRATTSRLEEGKESGLVLDPPLGPASQTASTEADLTRLWDLSHIGISNHETLTSAEKSAISTFENSLTFDNGRYIVSLPWRENHKRLPDNYSLAKRRLFGILKKLRGKPHLLKTYDTIIKDQVKRGFIEEVNPHQVHPEAKLHYLPHHGVLKESSTTSLRIVYDCSSNDPSLNSCLWAGPSLVADLTKLLLSFRLKPYAVSADIEKAFLAIGLSEKDRDSTRFLWLKEPENLNSPLVTYRFKSVLFGAACSPFLLAACLRKIISQSSSPYKETLFNQTYVDNIFQTFEKESELEDFFHSARTLFSEAGFNLRAWSSNSDRARQLFSSHSVGVEDTTLKILGMVWNVNNDSMSFAQRSPDSEASTKRKILKALASVFDPLGILSPVSVRGKILLQTLWKGKLSWDQTISDTQQREWDKVASDLSTSLSISLPRQLVFSETIDIHAFSDASGKAYASVVYIVSGTGTHQGSNIIMAKTRVAPLKELSIPKLELMGMVLSTRLINYVISAYEQQLNISNIYCWADSQVALHWLFSEKQLPLFTQNRVEEIRKSLPTATWRFVPTKENPCDMASRGATPAFLHSDLWLHGPQWLTNRSMWPEWSETPQVSVPSSTLLTVTKRNPPQPEPSIDISRFSSYHHLIRVTGLVLRFTTNLRAKVTGHTLLKSSSAGDGFSHHFTLLEQQAAEIFWVRMVQKESFGAELAALQEGKSTNLIKQLNIIMVDGLLRCDRRLNNAILHPDTKFPILLPSNHHFTKLLIMRFHLHHHHVGTNQLLSLLRQKYYIPHMRQTIKKIVRPCVLCKRLQGAHYCQTPITSLPRARVTEARPFSVVGIDYTGHFHVKVHGKVEKAYVVLFTCAVTRAVHLEVTSDNSSESFFNVLRRFISRRGAPSIIYSDNASNFKATSCLLQSLISHPSVRNYTNQQHISWRFNPSRASFYGGFYERLVGLTKMCLRRTLQSRMVTSEEFYTVLTEVELTLNTRPLTYTSDTLLEDDPLTPSHLLCGYNLQGLPIPEEFLDEDLPCSSKPILSQRQRRLIRLIDKFWSQWKTQYLVSLRQKWNTPHAPRIALGDVVLVETDGPRLSWKLGIITSLHPSSDGVTRSVTVKTKWGEITRAVVHLCPLEISSNLYRDNFTTSTQGDDKPPTHVLPERRAKTRAKEAIRAQSKSPHDLFSV